MKEYVITDELRDNIIKWFNNIAEEADTLTTGNVSHKKAMIKGMAAARLSLLRNIVLALLMVQVI